MTRQDELVWAAAWALGLNGRMKNEMMRDRAARIASEAVQALRWEALDESRKSSDHIDDVLLRQMAGEPDCFIRKRPPPQQGAVCIMCQHPQIDAAEHCHACAAFGRWPTESP